ncbi:trypsin-like peptidase domain-containing protein [Candidatus Woesearchaeota archaeon]|nr:trypsin-like peptidase domain-containing protein [Candidatus Woesearchaeota archaeon]
MAKPELDIKKILIISAVAILVVISGIIFYNNYRIKALNEEFSAKLLVMNKEILGSINSMQQDLDSEISSLRNNLTLKIDVIDTGLASFRKKNEQEIGALNSLIDEIEKQSDIKLNELKDEISTIQVKSTDFSAIIDDVVQSVVSVGTNKGQGSGAIIDDRGFIVTNYHVVEDSSIIRVLTYEGKVYDAALIGYNDLADVAVLKVNADLESLRFGDSDDVRVGERVIALGNPAGLSFTVTEGIVSAVHRPGPNGLNIYLQTDVPINPGNSGGPLVDANSRIIGLNNFKISGFEGLGFAIESNAVEQISDDIIEQYLQQTGQ